MPNPEVGITVLCQRASLDEVRGSLEDMHIPVAQFSHDTLHRHNMMHVVAMRHWSERYGVVLALDDVSVSNDARDTAVQYGVRIFQGLDTLTAYINELRQQDRDAARRTAVFPCHLQVLQAFRSSNPMILGVRILGGQLRAGTPLGFMRDGTAQLVGRVESIQEHDADVEVGTVGMEVGVKIDSRDTGIVFGRHFSEANSLISIITRQSVDAVRQLQDELDPNDMALLQNLIHCLGI